MLNLIGLALAFTAGLTYHVWGPWLRAWVKAHLHI